MGDSKPPHVSRTLLSILVDLNRAVVWMVLILLQIFRSLSLFSDYNWYHRDFHVPQLFQLSGKVQVFVNLFAIPHNFSYQYIKYISSFNWWFFTGVRVTAWLLSSPEHFSVSQYCCSPNGVDLFLALQFPPVSFPITFRVFKITTWVDILFRSSCLGISLITCHPPFRCTKVQDLNSR